MLNIFTIDEKYPNANENRLTASLMFLLSECRSVLLPEFLEKFGITEYKSYNIDIDFQIREKGYEGVPDARIKFTNEFHILIEAKLGDNILGRNQIKKYAKNLHDDNNIKQKKLLCLTQTNQDKEFKSISENINKDFPDVVLYYFKWYEVADFIKLAMRLKETTSRRRSDTIYKNPNYEKRLCELFLDYMRDNMYDKPYEFIDVEGSLEKSRIVEDIAIAPEDPSAMRIAKKYNIWLPSWPDLHVTPSKYVAYYEMKDYKNENPGNIAYIAKVIKYWTHIRLADAKNIEELKPLFKDPDVSQNWKDTEFGNFAKTEAPKKLNNQIKLGLKSNIRIRKRRYIDFIKFMNAKTIDDLLSKTK